MAVALITSITSPIYDGSNVVVTVAFVVSENNGGIRSQTGAFSLRASVAIGLSQLLMKSSIANAIVAQAREDGFTIENYGTPLPVGRAILFPDLTLDVL